MHPARHLPRTLLPLASLSLTAAVAACGGAATNAGSSSGGGGATPAGATLTAAQTSGGMVLAGPDGNTVYVLLSGSGAPIPCTGGCQAEWPPVTGSTAHAGNGVSATLAVGAGSQVTANGDPVYYFAGDSAPGQVNGEGETTNGGTWYAMQPNGQPLPQATKASPGPANGGY